MIRMSEAVLPGHPDRFSDQIADAIVAAAYEVDPRAYCQAEVSVWGDQVFVTGAIVTRAPLREPLSDIVRRVGTDVGYVPGNAVDANRYQVTSTMRMMDQDPRTWTDKVNDQSIIHGWAGYDAATCYLPPEHHLVQTLTAALFDACRNGALRGEGPDGKVLVVVRESSDAWALERLLVTLQQRETTAFTDFAIGVANVLRGTYQAMREADPRWVTPPADVEILINPNGPLLNGGSDGDNGQTGRKLVVDHYGPRIPIGGGALAGKDFSHVDRAGSYAARQAAVHAVETGAQACLVTLTYAPNHDAPLEVRFDVRGHGDRLPAEWFAHSAIRKRITGDLWTPALARGRHFADPTLPWNQGLRGHATGDRRER
jgi:S-adenosylmethionine synthetase